MQEHHLHGDPQDFVSQQNATMAPIVWRSLPYSRSPTQLHFAPDCLEHLPISVNNTRNGMAVREADEESDAPSHASRLGMILYFYSVEYVWLNIV